jgi:hypothetical protein
MRVLFWYLILYSFLGFVLEVHIRAGGGRCEKGQEVLFPAPPVPGIRFGRGGYFAAAGPVKKNWLLLLPWARRRPLLPNTPWGCFTKRRPGVKFWDYSSLRAI